MPLPKMGKWAVCGEGGQCSWEGLQPAEMPLC